MRMPNFAQLSPPPLPQLYHGLPSNYVPLLLTSLCILKSSPASISKSSSSSIYQQITITTMEKPSPSNLNHHPTPGRRIRLISATHRPTLPPPPPYSSLYMSSMLPSTSSSSDHQSGSPSGVVPRVDPEIRLSYPLCFRIGGTRNEAFQSPALAQPPSTERRVPLVPTAP